MRKIVLAMSLVSIMAAAQPLKAQTADSTTVTKPSFFRQHVHRASAMLGTNGVSL